MRVGPCVIGVDGGATWMEVFRSFMQCVLTARTVWNAQSSPSLNNLSSHQTVGSVVDSLVLILSSQPCAVYDVIVLEVLASNAEVVLYLVLLKTNKL